ncbi:MAG: hypothetical protein QF745_07855, partial [Planctomycetota bacterium]|nr:hypothetical protein [Planctomycetota bacterium]
FTIIRVKWVTIWECWGLENLHFLDFFFYGVELSLHHLDRHFPCGSLNGSILVSNGISMSGLSSERPILG